MPRLAPLDVIKQAFEFISIYLEVPAESSESGITVKVL